MRMLRSSALEQFDWKLVQFRAALEFVREKWNRVFPKRQMKTRKARACLLQSESGRLGRAMRHMRRMARYFFISHAMP